MNGHTTDTWILLHAYTNIAHIYHGNVHAYIVIEELYAVDVCERTFDSLYDYRGTYTNATTRLAYMDVYMKYLVDLN